MSVSRPEFKGIKTVLLDKMPHVVGPYHALNSKGLRQQFASDYHVGMSPYHALNSKGLRLLPSRALRQIHGSVSRPEFKGIKTSPCRGLRSATVRITP